MWNKIVYGDKTESDTKTLLFYLLTTVGFLSMISATADPIFSYSLKHDEAHHHQKMLFGLTISVSELDIYGRVPCLLVKITALKIEYSLIFPSDTY